MFWWYLTRATGVVATVLIFLALIWGTRFSARETGRRLKPKWWLRLHRHLGGLAFGFSVAHVVAVVVDPDAGFTIVQALVPGQADDLTTAMSYGSISLYLLVAVVATSWPRLRFRRRVWRAVHLTSIPAAALAAVHGYQAGSERDAAWFVALLAVLTGATVYPICLRLLSATGRGRARETVRAPVRAPTAIRAERELTAVSR